MNRLAQYFQQKYYPDLSIEEVAGAMNNPAIKENAIKHLHQNNYPDMDVNELASVAFQPEAPKSNVPIPNPFPVKEKFIPNPVSFNDVRLNSDNTNNYINVPKGINNPPYDPLTSVINQTVLDQKDFGRFYNMGNEFGKKYNNEILKTVNTGLEFVKTATPVLGDLLANTGQEFVSGLDDYLYEKDRYKSRLEDRIKKLNLNEKQKNKSNNTRVNKTIVRQ